MKTIEDIVIDATENELKSVVGILDCFMSLPISRKSKVVRTAAYDGYKKIKRKQLAKPRKKCNTYKLKLKAHEADALEQVLTLSVQLKFEHFANVFKNKINQKLA